MQHEQRAGCAAGQRVRGTARHLVAVKPDIDTAAGRVADDDRMRVPTLER